MTKKFCDKCKKEIEFGINFKRLVAASETRLTQNEYELHYECFELFKSWLDQEETHG